MPPTQDNPDPMDAAHASFPVLVKDLPEDDLERRADIRFDCNLPAWCDPLAGDGQKTWSAEIKDISAGGMALLAERCFEPGTVLVIEPPRKADISASLLARVVRAERHDTGKWTMGCQLVYRMGDDKLRELLNVWRVARADSGHFRSITS
jgi:PilZ domain